jgi:hypothetical protein
MPTKTRTTVREGATEKFLVYDSLAGFNQAFAQVLQNLRTLEKLCSLQHDFFSGLQVTLEETRAWANYEVLGRLHDREEIDWGRFGRLRRQWEKKNEDPNDILLEAARLKKPRQKSAGSKRLQRR